jgi:hypothetical protein
MKNKLIAATIACAFCAPATAQSPDAVREHQRILIDTHDMLAEAAGAKATADAWRQWGDDLRASLGTMFGDHFAASKVVKGAPYSAEVTTEMNQTLADGNVITRKTTGRVYRDGEGRTRQETVVNGEARSIQLRDPVEGTAVMLLPGSKKAVRLPSHASAKGTKEVKVLRLGDREIRIEDGKVSLDGKETAGIVELKAGGKEIRVENGRVTINGREMTPGEGGSKVIVKHVDEGMAGDGSQRSEVRVHVVRSGEGKEVSVSLPALPPLPAMAGGHFDGVPVLGKGTTTSLGAKEIEGVKAEGKSTVRAIAAGEIGNRNPISITSESWYSPELQLTVLSRQSDPRHGETIYRLTNIRRGEPSADLFKVPAEYSASGKRDRG